MPERHHAFAGVLSLLAEHAAQQPVLVLIDDAQWLDGGTLDAMFFAARRLHAERVAIVVAQRSDARTPFTGFDELRLEPLSEEQALALARRHALPELGDRTLAGLVDTAAGNPLAVVELARRTGTAARNDATLAERLFGDRIGELTQDGTHRA